MEFERSRTAFFVPGRPSNEPEPPDCYPDGHPRNPEARERSPTPGIRSRAAILETRASGKLSWPSGKQFSRSDSFPRRRARYFSVRELWNLAGVGFNSAGKENQG